MSFKTYLEKHNTQRELILFFVFSQAALLSQVVSRILLDLALKNLTQVVRIAPLPEQALGSLIAFFVSNVVAKTVAYVLNRKHTFKANNNAVSSAAIYTVMVVIMILLETIAGTPLQNALYVLFKGPWTGDVLNTASVSKPALYQVCGTLSLMLMGLADGTVTFVMDKFVIMKRHSNSKTPV